MVKKILLWVLVIGCMVLIFSFSAQSADNSMDLSDGLLNRILDFFNIHLAAETVMFMRVFIRKVAHFAVYMLLGFLVYLLFKEGYSVTVKKCAYVAVLICALYAVTDEVHQLFVPGRSGMVKDVFIDTAGASCGIIVAWALCLIIGRLIKRGRKNG